MLRSLVAGLRALLHPSQRNSQIEEELKSFFEASVADKIRSGMSQERAQRAARIEIGSREMVRHKAWSAGWEASVDSYFRDLRFAARQLRKSPGFAAAVVATLTLAVGVNTAVFSLLDGFLLRRLPYPEPDRVAALMIHEEGVSSRTGRYVRQDDDGIDAATWNALRQDVTAATVAAYGDQFSLSSGVNLQTGVEGHHAAQYVQSARISENYFSVLGIRPYLGRGFSSEEDRGGGPKAVVLSYGLWQSLFHSDRAVLGQPIELKGEIYTVVGVLPDGAITPNPAEVWVPVRAGDRDGVCAGGDNCGVLMRLKPGATWQQLEAQLRHLPSADFVESGYKTWFFAQRLQQYESRAMRPKLEVLMLAVGLILLIACGNLAGLMLVQIARRTQEIATRLALGATQAKVLRQLWVENLVLAVLGTGAAVALASIAVKGLQGWFPAWMIPAGGFALDWRVLAFAAGASLVTSLLFGVLPALESRRLDLRISLAASSRSTTGGTSRLRRLLISAEVALTVMLLAGTGLLVRTLVHLETLPPGFDPHNVMTAKASLNATYSNAAAFRTLLTESIAAMKLIPGVEDAAVGLSTPYERGLNTGLQIMDGPRAGYEWGSSTSYVTPGYFRTLRIPLLAGRVFTVADSATSEPVAVVNESFARMFFHETNAVGRHFQLRGSGTKAPLTVVGVIQDVVKEPGEYPTAPLAMEPVFYIPAAQVADPADWHVWFEPSWIVRTTGPLSGLREQMQRTMATIDPGLPFSGFYSMDDLMDRELQMQRVETLLLAMLAGLALLLAAVGIYALVSNLVVQRTREIGIRIALGSTLGEAIRYVASRGVMAACGGTMAGLAGCFIVLRVMKSAIYGVGVYDPMTLTVVPLLVVTIAGLASLLPALRITRIDPATTLRSE